MHEHTATYSPEDNKLRLYPACRLSPDEYAEFKAAGFRWAPKQELFVAPRWTPAREDLLLKYCGEIGDEDYSYEERAADRAERFTDYRDKRRSEAGDLADSFDAGPAAFGHQNQRRAERQASRHDRLRTHAVSQWGKAEYWQQRTAGVISHALHKSNPRTRRGRILTLESELRKHAGGLDKCIKQWEAWQAVRDCENADEATKAAKHLANYETGGCRFTHPRTGKESCLYYLLDDANDPLTGHEAAAMYLAKFRDPTDEDSYSHRWSRHYELRLTYERAMLGEEGGAASEADIEPGGWIRPSARDVGFGRAHVNVNGWCQVLSVHRSPATKRVTSVKVLGDDRFLNDREIKPRSISVSRLPENAYRPPTDEEREKFQAEQKAAKKKAKATAPKKPSLINPTNEDAERLQAMLNAAAKEQHDASVKWEEYKPSLVIYMTQAEYSARSKGTYSSFEARFLHSCGRLSLRASNCWSSDRHNYEKSLAPPCCKLRVRTGKGSNFYQADHVVVLTDKPQKPIPWDWQPAEKEVA